jgi:3-oxoacyl-[acyl-carrier protein] reductase
MTTVQPIAREWTFAEIAMDQTWQIERTFTADDLLRYAQLSGDFSPLHMDAGYASTTEFGGRVVHGMLMASLFSQLVGMWLPGKHALYLGQDLSFRRPVLLGETVVASARVISKNAATRALTLSVEIRNRDGKVAVSGTAKVKMRDLADIPFEQDDEQTADPIRKGRVVLVTGGSRGIGAEIARTLGRRGATVIVNYLQSTDSAQSVVQSIRHADGAALMVQADVQNAAAVQEMIGVVQQRAGKIDWVVNSVSSELSQREIQELDWSDFQRHLDSQLKSVLNVAQAVYPMMKGRGGAIVNVLSQVTAGVPPARMADYVSAKYALLGLSKALATEWAPDNIRVNMVSPGLVETDLTQHYPERAFKLEASRTPLKRIACPADVAAAVAHLLSDESSYLTGVNLFVTGGQVM